MIRSSYVALKAYASFGPLSDHFHTPDHNRSFTCKRFIFYELDVCIYYRFVQTDVEIKCF